jgi:hypothetical protein
MDAASAVGRSPRTNWKYFILCLVPRLLLHGSKYISHSPVFIYLYPNSTLLLEKKDTSRGSESSQDFINLPLQGLCLAFQLCRV